MVMFNFPVPVFFPLPLIPVPFHVSMVNPFVSGVQALTIVLGQRPQFDGNSPWLDETPLSIIVLGSVPAAFKRTPPVTLKKQDIHIDVRDHVHIGSRYHGNVRRSGKPDDGGIASYVDSYPGFPHMYVDSLSTYIHIYLGRGPGSSPCYAN